MKIGSVVKNNDGSYNVLDENGNKICYIQTPWFYLGNDDNLARFSLKRTLNSNEWGYGKYQVGDTIMVNSLGEICRGI